MDSYEDSPPLSDFFFHIVGDKSTYSQELQDLYVCYTLARGLQIENASPRRPALPLEIILCITRFAGYISVNPDPALTLKTSLIHCEDPHLFCSGYTTPALSRAHLSSMARIWLAYDPPFQPGLPVSTSANFLPSVKVDQFGLSTGLRAQYALGPTRQRRYTHPPPLHCG